MISNCYYRLALETLETLISAESNLESLFNQFSNLIDHKLIRNQEKIYPQILKRYKNRNGYTDKNNTQKFPKSILTTSKHLNLTTNLQCIAI